MAVLGAGLFSIVAVMTLLVALGLPLGEFTMGGQHKVLPGKLRMIAAFSFFVQIFAIFIVLQAGGFLGLWFSYDVTKYICIFFAIYLSLNTVMNLLSKSKKERYVMTPLALLAALSFWATALPM